MSKYNFFSFCSITELHDNHDKVVSPLGELSSKTRTYAKDPGFYRNASYTPTLINFHGLKDDVFSMIPDESSAKQLEISQWLYQQAVAGNITNDTANCLQQLKAQFTANMDFTSVGTMVTNSTIWLPSQITATQTLSSGDTVEFKIWFANSYFEAEYPYCEIIVVLPLPSDEIDKLVTLNYEQLRTRLAEETPVVIDGRVNTATDNGAYPYTLRQTLGFDVYDLVNTGNTTKVYFTVITYGNSADAEDQIYDAITTATMAAAKRPREEYEEAIPDLFNPLEFTCIPYWDLKGLQNKNDGTSTYSPIVDDETRLDHSKKYLTSLSESDLIKSFSVIPFLYKSISIAFVGKLSNHGGVVKAKALYPDYQLIPSTDSQYGWMEPTTTDFINGMESLIAGAEVLEKDGVPPTGIKRLVKNNVLYATRQIGRVKYSMIARSQFVTDGIITQ